MTGVYSHVKYMLHDIDERHSRPPLNLLSPPKHCGRARGRGGRLRPQYAAPGRKVAQ